MTPGIVFIASYPKSGNTWFRTFLNTLLAPGSNKVADINGLDKIPIASSRSLFEENTGLESSLLTQEEVDALRPHVFRQISASATDTLYMKIHDAFIPNAKGDWLFPPEATKAVIYLIRNPLDVAVSFAHHSSKPFDKIVEIMADESYTVCDDDEGFQTQLRQQHLNWSGHAVSWTTSPNRVCAIRYEDMSHKPVETFMHATAFLGLRKTRREVEAALEAASFKKLRQQEEESNFREKPQNCRFFFRKGRVGSWRDELPDDLSKRLIQSHQKVMRQFGYLDNKNRPNY